MEVALAELKALKERYDSPDIKKRLQRLSDDQGSQDIEEWAKNLYIAKRDHSDAKAESLNDDRGVILELIYDLVRVWNKVRKDFGDEAADDFEDAMIDTFKTRRIERILSFGVVMDRAQALYAMKIATSSRYGMHWYSKYHFDSSSPFYVPDLLTEEEQEEWRALLESYPGFPTMNKKLFQLLYSEKLGLQNRHPITFGRWSKPKQATRHTKEELVEMERSDQRRAAAYKLDETVSSRANRISETTSYKEEAAARQKREQELRIDQQDMQVAQEEELARKRLQLEEVTGRIKVSTPSNGRNVLTVLTSEPLVYEDTDGNLRNYAKLDFDKERAVIKKCLAEASRDIDLFFDSATRHRLLAAKTLRPNCLHFSGHGDGQNLLLEREEKEVVGATHPLDTTLLGKIITKDGDQPFKFVFVSTCRSKKAGQVFVEAGVPHVVCCHQEDEIQDSAAQDFTHQFYLSLAAGHTVKDSFQEGCNAVLTTPGLVDASEETKKFVLLPQDGNHDVSIFHAKEVKEWSPTARSSDNLIQDKLSYPPPQPFFGREVDVYRVVNLVLTKQLVSVVGEKGVGRKSLAYAVCHYINERKSIMEPKIDSIFVATDSKGFLRVLQDLHRQLMTRRGMTVYDVSNDMDFLIHSICDSISKKALLVIDGTDYVKDSAEQQGLVKFLRKLRERRGTKVLLIGLEPLQDPNLPEQDFLLSSLDFDSTIRLFCNLCPRFDTAVKQKVYREKLVSATEEWYRLGNVRRVESLYLALGGGNPGKTVEKAGHELSRTKIDAILSGRTAGPPMPVQTEEEPTRHLSGRTAGPPMLVQTEEEPSREGLQDVSGERYNNGDTPLHSASRLGQEDMVLTLTEHANPDVINATNNAGWTPLHEACSYGREVIASILLQRRANVNAQSCSRRTPLHLACARGHVRIMALLLNNGADIDAQDNNGNTPINEASRRPGASEVIELLVQRRADPFIFNNDLEFPADGDAADTWLGP